MARLIYKILRRSEFLLATENVKFLGSEHDERDGFIHFSTRDQLETTAHKHFGGASNLQLLEFHERSISNLLKWEPSRGGALFPHLYDSLDIGLATRQWKITGPISAETDFSFIEEETSQ
jgi:uncharacterized protein (DUF952 family)